MAIPVEPRAAGGAWSQLCGEEKRARILAVADERFSREGTALSMPALAAAVGVGVASVYRVFASKDDLLAALLVERLAVVTRRFADAARAPSLWPAMRAAVLDTVDEGLRDCVARDAWDLTLSSSDPAVLAARADVVDAIDALVERAHAQRAIDARVTGGDVRLIFRAARHADGLGSGGPRTLAELVLRGMAPRDA
jgi:AcrR family transcriptional regulator